jgi:hypothetical protein
LRSSAAFDSSFGAGGTSNVTVSVTPENGFNGAVNVTVQGLPPGVSATPGSSFTLQSGGPQAVTFSVSKSSPIGLFPVTVTGRSGANSHTAQVVLTTEPIVTVSTYQSGSVLYLESDSGTDVSRIGLQALWGGSIVEVSLDRTNFVNEQRYRPRGAGSRV